MTPEQYNELMHTLHSIDNELSVLVLMGLIGYMIVLLVMLLSRQ